MVSLALARWQCLSMIRPCAKLETENFSPDREWMPRLVLIAKNTYVWMDQLSQEYKRHITRLDQIPDEELEKLASWGFTGLWLIGLWERSKASAQIKQLMGNPEAIASAYSLFDYRIADELGGEMPTRVCVKRPGVTAYAWQAIWSPTIWGSILPG